GVADAGRLRRRAPPLSPRPAPPPAPARPRQAPGGGAAPGRGAGPGPQAGGLRVSHPLPPGPAPLPAATAGGPPGIGEPSPPLPLSFDRHPVAGAGSADHAFGERSPVAKGFSSMRNTGSGSRRTTRLTAAGAPRAARRSP